MFAAARDVTDRKRAEEALQASEQALRVQKARLDLAVASARIGLWDLDLATNQAWRTPLHDQLFGYDELQPSWGPDEALRHVVEEDRPIFQRAFEQALRHRAVPVRASDRGPGRFASLAPGGRPAAPGRDRTADPDDGLGGGRHPAQMAELALRHALDKLERHVAGSPMAIIEWDPGYRIREWNPRAEEMFGWTAAEAVGKAIDELPWVPEEDWPSVRAVSDDMAKGERSRQRPRESQPQEGRPHHPLRMAQLRGPRRERTPRLRALDGRGRDGPREWPSRRCGRARRGSRSSSSMPPPPSRCSTGRCVTWPPAAAGCPRIRSATSRSSAGPTTRSSRTCRTGGRRFTAGAWRGPSSTGSGIRSPGPTARPTGSTGRSVPGGRRTGRWAAS